MEQLHSPEPEPQPRKQPTPQDLICAARYLTMNAYQYAVSWNDSDEQLDPLLASEFQDRFTQLARHQKPQSAIGLLFTGKLELADIFANIDTELKQLEKSIVASQVAPLEDYVEWLLKAHSEEALSRFEPDMQRDMVRRFELARIRFGLETS